MKLSSSRVMVALQFLLAFCICAPLDSPAWQTRPPRSGLPNQALLNGPNATPVVYQGDKLSRAAENQLELRLDVQRLYALSTELKDEVDHSDANALLNVSVLKRTQDIEKLAKQIRERAKR
jgi:hypothetical protein